MTMKLKLPKRPESIETSTASGTAAYQRRNPSKPITMASRTNSNKDAGRKYSPNCPKTAEFALLAVKNSNTVAACAISADTKAATMAAAILRTQFNAAVLMSRDYWMFEVFAEKDFRA